MRSSSACGLLLATLLGLGCVSAAPPAATASASTRALDPIFAGKGALSSAVPMLPHGPGHTAAPAFFPSGLSFAAARGREEASAPLEVRNGSDQMLEVRALELDSAGTPFRLRDLPSLPARVPPGGSLRMTIAFTPGPETALGVYHAQVRARTDLGPPQRAPLAGLLFALPITSEDEPPLQAIVETLGLAIDVGGKQAVLGSSAGPIGAEVPAPLFERAGAGPVTLLPVACFSVKGLGFGYYLPPPGAAPLDPRSLATFVVGQNKHLRPRLAPPEDPSFEVKPGQRFGVWLQGANRSYKFFTEDERNADTKHRARVYPLRAPDGTTLPHEFLIAFENWVNWDYQDAVFILGNVKPAR
jgi:hypothetical protein